MADVDNGDEDEDGLLELADDDGDDCANEADAGGDNDDTGEGSMLVLWLMLNFSDADSFLWPCDDSSPLVVCLVFKLLFWF